MNSHEVDVCVAGGGPAGMLLGLLLAKLGTRVLVLEQHRDFHREYRGEVLMPRFTQLFRQLNLFAFLESYHHLKLDGIELFYQDKRLVRVPFSEIAPEAPFAIWMPQPILLGALRDKARQFPSFDLWFDASVKEIVREKGRAVGLLV